MKLFQITISQIKFSKIIKIIILLIFISGINFGCSKSNEYYFNPENRKNTIVIALQSEGKTLDPHKATDAASMRLIENMYSTLMRYTNIYGEVENDLAENYSISQDNKVFTFKIKKGVLFHNTKRELQADDIKFSIQRIIDNQVRASQFEVIDKIKIPNPYTIIFELKEPTAPFLTYLAYPMNAIVDRKIVEKNNGRIDLVDAGSGPFELYEWKKDQHFILKKFNDFYIKERPILDKIIFKPISDDTVRSTALRNKEIDIILDVAAKNSNVLKKYDYINLINTSGTFWEYLGLNTIKKPLDNVNVRKAISWAINRNEINNLVKFGQAKILTGGNIPSNHWAFANIDIYKERNIDKAKELLKKSGLENGFDIELKVGSSFSYQVNAAQIIKQQLKDIGINVKITPLESSLFFDSLGRKNFEMAIAGWLGFVDPDEWLYNIYHSDAKWNQQNYSNPKLDLLLEKGKTIIDKENRKEIYKKAQKIIVEEVPTIYIYINSRMAAYLKSVKGFDVHPTVTTISLRDTYKR